MHLPIEMVIFYSYVELPEGTENDNMILLQTEDWPLSSSYLKGKLHHYKMKTCFYHQGTWGASTTNWLAMAGVETFQCFPT